MTIHWKAIEQCLTVVLFIFRFFPVCYFEKVDNFGFGIIKSERVRGEVISVIRLNSDLFRFVFRWKLAQLSITRN